MRQAGKEHILKDPWQMQSHVRLQIVCHDIEKIYNWAALHYLILENVAGLGADIC